MIFLKLKHLFYDEAVKVVTFYIEKCHDWQCLAMKCAVCCACASVKQEPLEYKSHNIAFYLCNSIGNEKHI